MFMSFLIFWGFYFKGNTSNFMVSQHQYILLQCIRCKRNSFLLGITNLLTQISWHNPDFPTLNTNRPQVTFHSSVSLLSGTTSAASLVDVSDAVLLSSSLLPQLSETKCTFLVAQLVILSTLHLSWHMSHSCCLTQEFIFIFAPSFFICL